jgi:small conductance mechanosensitive channel
MKTGQMNTAIEKLIGLGTEYGLKVVGAVIILILGRIAAGVGRKAVRRVLRKARADKSIVTFVGSLIFILILTFAVVATLAKFGVQTASFVAVLGAGAFAVGMALQGSLSNFASGVLTLIFRPYKVGDYIEAGSVAGTVKELHLFSTTLATPDGIKIIVPNSKMYGDVIKNYSANDTRRIDLAVGISYDSDIQKAQGILMSLMTGDERALDDPAPQVVVSELGESSVNLVARCWAKRDDFWPLKFDLTRRAKEEFDKNNIEIPFPQRVVHMVSGGSEG